MITSKELIQIIIGFVLERTGNQGLDIWKEKRKIKRILKKDRKNIKSIFSVCGDSDYYNLIEQFIMFWAFTDVEFFSEKKLTEEEEEQLWNKFKSYIEKETAHFIDKFDCKEKIVRCINLHNMAINEIIMDEKSRFQMKVEQKSFRDIKKILSGIVDTLNSNTKLQEKDEEIGFGIEQMESIVKSYRFDIGYLRRIQVLSIIAAMLVLLIMGNNIPLHIDEIENIYSTIIMGFFMVVVVFITLKFWRSISEKLTILEDELNHIRKKLWYVHYELYENQIGKKLISDSDIYSFCINGIEVKIHGLIKQISFNDSGSNIDTGENGIQNHDKIIN